MKLVISQSSCKVDTSDEPTEPKQAPAMVRKNETPGPNPIRFADVWKDFQYQTEATAIPTHDQEAILKFVDGSAPLPCELKDRMADDAGYFRFFMAAMFAGTNVNMEDLQDPSA